jgi:curved DNA-binding protein CbpA
VTQAELVKAARKKRIETHPDKFSGRNISPAEVDAIIETSKTVGHAADILCDPAARAKYDGETATWKKQRAASRGVPEGMSYFGSNSQASEDQPKHQSSGFNAYTEPHKAATSQKR